MKTVGLVLAGVLLVLGTSLHLPSDPRLELYEVQDLVYDLPDFPSVDISLATKDPVDPILHVDLILLGSELADRLQPLVPGSDVPVQFQNGLIIVRGTSAQHVAVRAALAAHRVRNSAVTSIIDGISRAKAALRAKLFGMITK